MDKNIREAKEAYITRRNRENLEIESLTDEQHEALQTLCAIRHRLHTSWQDMWNPESSGYNTLWDYVRSYDIPKINEMLLEADLPTIEFNEYWECPCLMDYEVLEADEKEEWEAKAEEFNKTRPARSLSHSGWSLWQEESGEYEIFAETMEEINSLIEQYLAAVDKEHGTSYCPTGAARIRGILF